MHEIIPDGAAAGSDKLEVGDAIVSIDGKQTKDMTHEQVVRAIMGAKDKVG